MLTLKVNDSQILLNHMALVISSLEGNIPGPMALSIRALRIFLVAVFSKVFTVILFFNDEDTCVSILSCVVLCIIMSALKATSGKLSQKLTRVLQGDRFDCAFGIGVLQGSFWN